MLVCVTHQGACQPASQTCVAQSATNLWPRKGSHVLGTHQSRPTPQQRPKKTIPRKNHPPRPRCWLDHYFKAKLTSPGRSIPWVEADFNYTIPGGLEPKETATWKLSPNMFSEWAKAPNDRTDLVLVTELVRLNGADGKSLYDSAFSERKQKRVEVLQASLAKGDY